MMDNRVRESILNMIRDAVPVQTIVARVEGCDLTRGVCDVVSMDDEDYTLYDVRLQAIARGGTGGITIVPVVGSFVLVSMVRNIPQSGYISCYSDVEKIHWNNDDGITLEISDKLRLNGDKHGGMVILQKLVEKINALEQAMNTHVHSGVTTGSGSTAVATPPPIDGITQLEDLENKNVTHG
jgi:hypothetical protein